MRVPSRFLCFLAAVLAVANFVSAQVPAPEYQSVNNVLQHTTSGGYRVEVGKDLKYVGGTRFFIRTAADAEMHLYAKADANGNIQRLVWVQIESQLPGQNWQYNYPSPDRTTLGTLEFITNTRASRSYVPDDPTSDFAFAHRMLKQNHLQFAGPVLRLRMIYLPDSERRRELMVIYAAALPQQDAAKIPSDDGVEGSEFPELLKNLKSEVEKEVRARVAR